MEDIDRDRRLSSRLKQRWVKFWMRQAGLSPFGRLAARFAAFLAPPHKNRVYLSEMYSFGYVAPSAIIHHMDVTFGKNFFMDDRAIIFQRQGGKSAVLGDRVRIYRDTILETGFGGSIELADYVSIHPRCQLNAYVADIRIGKGTMVAPNCAFYSYDHGIEAGIPIRNQPLISKGPIVVGDESWISVGATILSGVTIGSGAIVGAGAIVAGDIPDNAIAVGNPAKVVRYR